MQWVRAAGRGWGPPRATGGILNPAGLRPSPFSLLLKKAQHTAGNARKALNPLTVLERESHLPASGPEHWVGAGPLQVLGRRQVGWPGEPWLEGDIEMGPRGKTGPGAGKCQSPMAGKVWAFLATENEAREVAG